DVGIVFGAFCLVSLVRIAFILAGFHFENDFFRTGTSEKLIMISYQLLVTVLVYSLMLMVNQRLLIEVKAQEEKFSKEIRESEEQIKLLLNSTAEAICGVDINGICTFCNPTSLKMLGYDTGLDLIGKYMHTLFHHTRSDGTKYPSEECPNCRTLLDGSKAHIQDEVFWRTDGSSFFVEYWSYPIWRGKELVGAVLTFIDITERKHAEEALYESRNMLVNILNSVPQYIFWKDHNSVYLGCNYAFTKAAGIQNVEEIVGKTDFDLPWSLE
ncbi:MAG: PAS domain S-box protein, partial [Deltaproteobacteria bacterium]|nr:PAS domain S-box protein [Deltaproteobacteria bacterium]